MKAQLTKVAREILPPIVTAWMRRVRGRELRFEDCGPDWDEARAISAGYDQSAILERVAAATREVVAGRATYERDSLVFHRSEFRFPVVAALLHDALLGGGRLDVIDFGGALGSAYWQSRPFLRSVQRVNWRVVEQAGYVALGRAEFTNGQLGFDNSVGEAGAACERGLAMLGGVLQYVPDPEEVLKQITQTKVTHLLIDRTPMSTHHQNRLTIQHTPREIYPASYPHWIFSTDVLLRWLGGSWRLLAEIDCPEGRRRTDKGIEFEFRGLYLERVG